MSDSPPPAPAGRMQVFMETYGTAAIVTILGLFAVEMAVFTPLVRYGVDLTSLYAWLESTFSWELGREVSSSPSWLASAAIAYAITRPLKPVQLAVAVPITPVVASLLGSRAVEQGTSSPSGRANASEKPSET